MLIGSAPAADMRVQGAYMAVATGHARSVAGIHPNVLRAAGLVAGAGMLVVVALLSLRIGSIEISTREVWRALFEYDPASYNQVVVRSLRVPRTLIAIGVGGGLAVAGAVMQAVTRNPLASPSILG